MRFLGLLLAAIVSLAIPSAHAQMVSHQTGTTYTFQPADCDPQGLKAITFNNSSAVSVTLPQAGANSQFLGGCTIQATNIGSGTVTITPTSSTINGTSALALTAGQSARIVNDAAGAATGNYFALLGAGSGGGSVTVPTTTLVKTTSPSTFSQVTAIDNIPIGQVTPAAVSGTAINATSSLGLQIGGVSTIAPDGFGGQAINLTTTADPATTGTQSFVPNIFRSTLNPSTSNNFIWIHVLDIMNVNGPGVMNKEIGLLSPHMIINAGANAAQSEELELRVDNAGIIGTHAGALITQFNDVGGTVTGGLYGTEYSLTNNDTTAGDIFFYAAMSCTVLQGGGAQPTNKNCLYNNDPFSQIQTLGKVNIGSIGNVGSAILLNIVGPDALSSSFPIFITNSANARILTATDGGVVSVGGAVVVGGATPGLFGTGTLILNGNVSGHIALFPGSGTTLTNATLTLPDVTDTLAVLNTAQQWGAKQTMLASGTGGASFNIPQGAAPTSPANGDIWTTSSGVFAQIAGATVGPFGAGGGGGISSITAGTGLTGGTITTSGTIAVDFTSANTWTGLTTVQGPDNTATTAFRVLNLASTGLLVVPDNGNITMSGNLIVGTLGTAGGGSLTLNSNSNGTGVVKLVPGSTQTVNSTISFFSPNATDTVMLQGTNATITAAILNFSSANTTTFNGALKIGTGTFSFNSSPSGTPATFACLTSGFAIASSATACAGATLSGTSSSIGGSALLAGACASTTVAITGLTTSMALAASPTTYPGDGNFYYAYASAAGTATVKICAAVADTPTASTYNIRVLQ